MPPTSHHFEPSIEEQSIENGWMDFLIELFVSHPGSEPAGGRRYRLATVCLGILCFLLLLIITVLYVYYKGALSDIVKKHDILTRERSLLQTKYNTVKAERDQLHVNYITVRNQRDQLQTNYSTVKTERDQLQTNYSTMLADVSQLLRKYSTCTALKNQEHRCPVAWSSFNLKCYYISDTKKNWTESQVDCRQRGADLVVIDSKHEQTFLSQFQRSWIGLTDKEQEGIYKWVDGTPLTTSYWIKGEPNDQGQKEDCIEILNIPGTLENWNDQSCSEPGHWICEREGLD